MSPFTEDHRLRPDTRNMAINERSCSAKRVLLRRLRLKTGGSRELFGEFF